MKTAKTCLKILAFVWFVALLAAPQAMAEKPGTDQPPPSIIVQLSPALAALAAQDLVKPALSPSEFNALVKSLLSRPSWSGQQAFLNALTAIRATGLRAPFRNSKADRTSSPERAALYGTFVIRLANPAASLNAEKLEATAGVLSVEPDAWCRTEWLPNDPFFASAGTWGQPYDDLWALKRDKLDAELAWNLGFGAGILVAVVDSGVDRNHPELNGQVWQNAGEIAANNVDDDGNGFVDDVRGWNFQAGHNDTMDVNGHGTFCAGIIAARGNNARGIIGVAPQAKVMPLTITDAEGDGLISDAAAAIVYAVDKGARVINLSVGDYRKLKVITSALAVAYQKKVVAVCSAGNDSCDKYHTPGSEVDAICVAASDPADLHCEFSNKGYWLDVCAPGGDPDPFDPCNILSLLSAVHSPDLNPLVIGGQYCRMAGTSASAPYVSGAAALILGLHPDYEVDVVRSLLRASAETADGGPWSYRTGYGRINLNNLVRYNGAGAARIRTPLDRHFRIRPGDAVQFKGKAFCSAMTKWRLEWGHGESPAAWNPINGSVVPQPNGALCANFVFPGAAAARVDQRCVQLTVEGPKQFYQDKVWVTIDPKWKWTKLTGGVNDEAFVDMALDAAGNVYTLCQLGRTDGVDYFFSIAVCKFDGDGNLLWARTKGSNRTFGGGIAVDAAGNVYATGMTKEKLDGQPNNNPDGDMVVGDIFVIKYDTNGNWKWTRIRGSADADAGNKIACDNAGNVYVGGDAKAAFDGQPFQGNADMLVMKYNPAGVWQWTRFWGTPDFDRAHSIVADGAGNTWVTGPTGALLDQSVFVRKYSPAGVPLDSVVHAAPDAGYAIATDLVLDAARNVYLTGYMRGLDWDGEDNPDLLKKKGFAQKYNAALDWQWTRLFGSEENNEGASICLLNGRLMIGAKEVYPVGGFSGHPSTYLISYTTAGALAWRDNIFANSEWKSEPKAVAAKENVLYTAGRTEGPYDGAVYKGMGDGLLMQYKF